MKSARIIEDTRTLIDSILTNRKRELAALEDKIKEDTEAVSIAIAAMEKATAEENVKAYREAKAERENAQDAKEMHEARMNALMNKPLISRAEYEDAVSGIYAAVAADEAETKKTLFNLSNQMAAASADLETVTHDANDVLRRLQHDIYQDADRSRNPKTGEPMPLAHEDKQVNPFDTIYWGRKGVNCEQFKKYSGDVAQQ